MEINFDDCTLKRGVNIQEKVWSLVVEKYSRSMKGVRRKEEGVVRNRDRRGGKKGFLKADNLRCIARKEMTKVITVGDETSKIPLDQRQDEKCDR